MSLFKSKYKTSVATTVSRVIEDNKIPNSIKTGALTSLSKNDDQLVEYAMEELIAGVGIKAHRMYSYGKNNYTYGCPKSNMFTPQSGKETVRAVIEGIVATPIVIDYYNFGAFNNLHFGWFKLTTDHGYNTVTNGLSVLTTAKGFPVFLDNMVVVVANATLEELENGSLKQWGIPPSAGPSPLRPNQTWEVGKLRAFSTFEVDSNVLSDYLRVEYSWYNTTTKTLHQESMQITVAGMDDTADYHQVKYMIGNVAYYWLYKAQAGLYPTIDALFNPAYEQTGSYFPWHYYRYNKIDQSVDKTTPAYATSKKLANFLNINFDDMAKAIHDNPDIGQVEQAMMMMAVPANTTNQLEMRYLFDYFKAVHITTGGRLTPIVKQPGKQIWNYLDNAHLDATVMIQDTRFRMGIGFRNIFRVKTPGVIGAIGHYTSGFGEEISTETGKNQAGAVVTVTSTGKYHYYRKQITEKVYEEIRVINLRVVYHIFEQYNVTADENDEILLIPLDRSITRLYSIPDREILYSRSLHFVFNSLVVTKIKWYQQAWFRNLLIIVAIVLTVLSFGKSWKLIVAAMAVGTVAAITAALITVLWTIIGKLVTALLFKLFVKAVGMKNAFIVAVLTVIAAIATRNFSSLANAPWAAQLMQVATGITTAIEKNLRSLASGLEKEYKEFGLFVTAEEQRLKDANKLLETSITVSPLIIFGEKPNDYYARTVHSGNIGVMSIDAISSFVAVSLTLPDINKTIEDNQNEVSTFW